MLRAPMFHATVDTVDRARCLSSINAQVLKNNGIFFPRVQPRKCCEAAYRAERGNVSQ